jgi:hypothetical protein
VGGSLEVLAHDLGGKVRVSSAHRLRERLVLLGAEDAHLRRGQLGLLQRHQDGPAE